MVGSVSGINGETLKFEFMAVVNLLRLTARYSSKLHTHTVPVSDVSHMRATKSLFLPAMCHISINTEHTRRKRLKRTVLCRKGIIVHRYWNHFLLQEKAMNDRLSALCWNQIGMLAWAIVSIITRQLQLLEYILAI